MRSNKMQNFFVFLSLCTFIALIVSCRSEPSPTEEFPHEAVLDEFGNVKLYWKFNDTYITFELHGNTTGWIGMGISPSGSMIGADIVVGWVKEGNAEISDRHGTGTNSFPPMDPEKNVELLEGIESDGWTAIKFQRQIASCEPEYDLAITSDTLRIIYAFGSADPTGNEFSRADYHQENRGVKQLILLEVTQTDQSIFPEGEQHFSFDLLNDNFEIPAETTYYNCRLHKIPEFTKKQHLVKVEPVIQPGNEKFVHHILIYQCTSEINETLSLGRNHRCYASDMPPDFLSCSYVIQGWAIGGGAIYYPSHAGFPLGEEDSPKYVVVETHYDNPTAQSGVIDSSGLRLTYTEQLRQYDAALIQMGVAVSGTQQIIPPNIESFLSYGECSEKCLNRSFENHNITSVNIFGAILHTHLLGTGLKLRHIRNGVELSYITEDNAYDFNYQETRMLKEEREVKMGDSIQLICDYKTKDARTNMTVGGLDTEKEMCLAFVYYYPKMSLQFCQTSPEFFTLLKYFGVENIVPTVPQFGIYNDIYDLIIIKPEHLTGQTLGELADSMDWNEETGKQFSEDLRNMTRIENCRGTKLAPESSIVSPPVIDVPYVQEEQACIMETTTLGSEITTTTGAATKISSFSLWLYCLVLACLHFAMS